MRVAQNKLQKIKAAIHCVQALFIFIAGCLALAVMTKDGGYGKQTGFFFALCFLSLPAILYQLAVPVWSRAWRLNNVYAFASIDTLFAILWFAASIAVAVWNSNGIAKGKLSTSEEAPKATKRADVIKNGKCASFGFGSEAKCKVSEASVGFGMMIFFMFTMTSYIAIRTMIEFRRTRGLPEANMHRQAIEKADALSDDDESNDPDPWSTNTDELGNSNRPPYAHHHGDDREELLGRDIDDEAGQSIDDMAHPGRRLSYQSTAHNAGLTSYMGNLAPSALSPTGPPKSPGGRPNFAESNYSAFR